MEGSDCGSALWYLQGPSVFFLSPNLIYISAPASVGVTAVVSVASLSLSVFSAAALPGRYNRLLTLISAEDLGRSVSPSDTTAVGRI